MPYQGSAGSGGGSDSGGSVATVMPAQAPPDLGTGAGGLTRIGTTQVVGRSGTPGANLPVDAIQQASSMIAQGKADLGQTAGAETRLNGFDAVGGGGGGGGGGANNATGGGGTNAQNVNTSGTGTGGNQKLNAGQNQPNTANALTGGSADNPTGQIENIPTSGGISNDGGGIESA